MIGRAAFICLLSTLLGSFALGADATNGAHFKLPAVGGLVMTGDNETLIVSLPTKKQLVYFDTLADKEIRRVDLDFQPVCLARQGKLLFAAAKDVGVVYALEVDSGSEKKKMKMPGDPAMQLACNPDMGPVYASTAKHRIFAIDPGTGKVDRTKARGLLLAADARGSALYTGMIEPYRERIKVTGGKDGSLAIEFDNTGRRGMLLKYVPAGKDLKLVDGNPNAAAGAGGALAVTPDGQHIAFVAEGGWSALDKKERTGPVVFATDDLGKKLGTLPFASARNIAFHSVLSLGAALGTGDDVTMFDPKALSARGKVAIAKADYRSAPNLVTFGGKGTKVIIARGEHLFFLPIALTEKERAALTEVYGTLP